MKLTREQVNVIIKNGQAKGLKGRDILDGLISRGYEIEGVSTTAVKQQLSKSQQAQPSASGTLLGPLREGISGLKTLYGGGEEGLASKIKQNITAGAKDIGEGASRVTDVFGRGDQANIDAKSQVAKGIIKAGARTAGDVAGAIYAPVGAALNVATGGQLSKGFDYIANKIVDSPLGNKLTDNKQFQDFAMNHPNAGEDFGRALSLAFAARDAGKIDPKTALPRTLAQVKSASSAVASGVDKLTKPLASVTDKLKAKVSSPSGKSVEQMRSEKVTSGYQEQNARLKSVNNSFNKNTKTYKNPDGTVKKVTPVDTLSKNNIKPEISKGTIDMGNYQQETGALGKIKVKVGEFAAKIDAKLVDGKPVSIDTLKKLTIARIKADSSLKESGKVSSTVKKLDAVFEDYKSSYGETLTNKQVNAIRNRMNQDWHPDTVDVSRAVGDAARKIVYKVSPESRGFLQKQGELLAAKKYAEALNGTKVTGGRLGNYVLRTGGAVVGATVKGVPIVGPLAGMLGGEYLARLMQQSQFTSFPAEAKALFQRLNKNQPTKSAKASPKTDSISPKTTTVKPKAQQGFSQMLKKEGLTAGTKLTFTPDQIMSQDVGKLDAYVKTVGKELFQESKAPYKILNGYFVAGQIKNTAQKLNATLPGLGDGAVNVIRSQFNLNNMTVAQLKMVLTEMAEMLKKATIKS